MFARHIGLANKLGDKFNAQAEDLCKMTAQFSLFSVHNSSSNSNATPSTTRIDMGFVKNTFLTLYNTHKKGSSIIDQIRINLKIGDLNNASSSSSFNSSSSSISSSTMGSSSLSSSSSSISSSSSSSSSSTSTLNSEASRLEKVEIKESMKR